MNKKSVANNAFWIISIHVLKSLLGMIISMFTARFLGPSNFGLINYASSIVTFVAPIMYLGLNNILVQELVDSPQKEGEILGSSLTFSLISAIFCIGGVFSFVSIVNSDEKITIIVCLLYSILLIFQALEMLVCWFQAKLLSKYSSLVMLVAYIFISCYRIFLLATEKNIYWFAISYALDYLIIVLGLFIIYKKLGGAKLCFKFETAKKLLQKSRYYIVSSMMVTIFAQTDRIMLKLMIDDAATGFYSAAVVCASLTGFVFSAIIDSFRPLIFEDKKHSKEKYERDVKKLYGIIIYISLLQSIVITLFSTLIVNILYGAAFSPTINALRIIVWYTTFSYLGSVRNIWILAENKQKYLWIINLSGAIANIVLNLILIPISGVCGAALASLITQIFTNVIVGFIIKPIRYNNVLMLQSLNPKILINTIKTLLKNK